MLALKPVTDLQEFARKVREFLFRREDVKLAALINATGDEELAHILDSLPVKEKRRLFLSVPQERRTSVIEKLSAWTSAVILRSLPKETIQQMIAGAESDDAVDIIQMLEEPMRPAIIADLRKSDPRGLLPLLGFDAETAGGLMQTELLKFQAGKTVDEVRRALAPGVAGKPRAHLIYVVGANDALVGTLPLLHLLTLPGAARLEEVMNVQFPALPATMEEAAVVKAFDEHNAVELPVIGAKGRLLGRITADDIFEVMEKEYAADIARLSGVDEDDHITDPVRLTVRRRLPWLVLNLATAVLAGWVVTLFQDTIERAVVLAAVMPIISGMGGNAATQTLGVAVRAIALGEMHHLNTAHAIAKEIAAGTLNGFANGVLMGALAFAWTGNAKLAFIIVVAMTANLFVAGLGGVAIPVVMKRLRIDPARSATVFVTTLTDVCGFFVFLGLASLFF